MSSAGAWKGTLFAHVFIFNVGRGLSVFMKLPNGYGMLYDLGSCEEFSPVDFVNEHFVPHLVRHNGCALAQCFMSHPHHDHIAEVDALLDEADDERRIYPHLLTCPNDRDDAERVDWGRIERDDNQDIINKYKASFAGRKPPLQTIYSGVSCPVPNLEYGFSYMTPEDVSAMHEGSDQDYVNGLSLVAFLRFGKQTIVVPGDITPDVFREVLAGGSTICKRYSNLSAPKAEGAGWHRATSSQPSLGKLLEAYGLSVLVAPHHGLESGFCPDVFEWAKGGRSAINVISEKRHTGDCDGTVDARYQSEETAVGVQVDIEGRMEDRYSVSTREGKHILVILQGTTAVPRVFLRSNPEELLDIT